MPAKKTTVQQPEGAPAPPVDDVDAKLEAFASVMADRINESEAKTSQAIAELGELVREVVSLPQAQGQVSPETESRDPGTSIVGDSLPPGVVRFFSPTREYQIFRDTGATVIVNNKPVVTPPDYKQFSNGILDVDEASGWPDFLRNHVDFNVDFFEDPTAVPTAVHVTEGARSSGTTRRAPDALLASKL